MSNPQTSFRVGDLIWDLVAKILRKLGGSPTPNDTEEGLWRKIVVQLGGTSTASDTKFDSLLKIERILDIHKLCKCGDTEVDLLKAILRSLGGVPRPDDTEFDLDRKILEAIA
jgi:hypothetical protein